MLIQDFIVLLDRSAGNAEIGEMWTETKVFPSDATLSEVYEWVNARGGTSSNVMNDHVNIIRANVRIASAQ